MAILVDDSRWWFKDRLWCHMVSDVSLDELHEFARSLEIPTRAFHGDHYDLPDYVRATALERGARAVTSRELVQRLITAGLRLSAAERRTYKHATDAGQGSDMSVSDRGQ